MEENNNLKLENQLCFPLYACSRKIIKKYKPLLDKYDLTYTQYITMMVLWEKKQINLKELGEALDLDSGTLTPVLKKLENKGYISRNRDKKDERNLFITITNEGESLRKKVSEVPKKMAACLNINQEEAAVLYKILYKILKEN